MPVTLFGIPNCETVKKARAWLEQRGVAYTFHDFKKAGVDAKQLGRWCDQLGWETVLNRAGTTFRKLAEADKTDLDRKKALALMQAHPSLIKRPVVEHPASLLIGFKPEAWADAFA